MMQREEEEQNPQQGNSGQQQEGAQQVPAAYSGFADAIKRQQGKIDERTDRVKNLEESWNRSLSEGRSIMSSFLNRNQPVYDQAREDRLRKGAMILALGNILGSAFGAVAGYRGANYAAPGNPTGPLQILDEMNRMRQEYHRRNERWQDLKLGIEQRNQAEDADRARLAYERELALLDRDQAKLDQLNLAQEQGRLDWERMQEQNRINEHAAQIANEREIELIRERGRQSRITSSSRGSSSGGSRRDDSDIEQMYILGRALGLIEDPKTTSRRERVPSSSGGSLIDDGAQYQTVREGTKWEDMDPEQKRAHLQSNRDLVTLYEYAKPLFEEGLDFNVVLEVLRQYAHETKNRDLLRLLNNVLG